MVRIVVEQHLDHLQRGGSREAHELGIWQLPTLKDDTQGVARHLGVKRTGEVIALGADPVDVAGGEADQGTMSERGFVMDGLAGPLRNTAVLVLELPREPVGPEATWALGTDLVDLGSVPGFVEKKAERRNQVKLTALTPGENGEQVATLEYDLSESLSGALRAPRVSVQEAMRASKTGGHANHEDHEDGDESPKGEQSALAEMRVKGRGEFLVKAGRWRSWEATLTTRTEGTTLPGTADGERTLRLTPLDSVPPELLQPQAKK